MSPSARRTAPQSDAPNKRAKPTGGEAPLSKGDRDVTTVEGESAPQSSIANGDSAATSNTSKNGAPSVDSPGSVSTVQPSTPEQSPAEIEKSDGVKNASSTTFQVTLTAYDAAVAFVKDKLNAAFASLASLAPATHMAGMQHEDGVSSCDPTATVKIEDVFPSSPSAMKRVAQICCNRGTNFVRNLALVSEINELKNRNFIFEGDKYPSRFFTVGVVVASSVTSGEQNRQLSILPLSCLWHRAMAVIAVIVNSPFLYFYSYRGGVTFMTQWKRKEASSPVEKKKKRFPAKLAWDENIPVYDGTKQFDLGRYTNLNPIDGEIPIGSTVLCIFTVQRYDLAKEKREQYVLGEEHKNALSFNALAVIVLAAKDDATTLPEAPLTQAEAYGVLMTDEFIAASKRL